VADVVKTHVIIGNSGAAISAVRAIRNVNREDKIILLSKEDCYAYSPVLTTYYLSGEISYEDMFFCNRNFYIEHKVKAILGKKAVGVDTDNKKIRLEEGRSLRYDSLLVATGSSSLVPPIEGAELPKVFTLWTADDAREILKVARRAKRVVVVGSGLIGMQTLKAMAERKKMIVLIETMSQIGPEVLDRDAAKIIQAKMEKRGVDVRLNERVSGILERDGKKVLSLSSGRQVQADIVVLATGVTPNIDLLQDGGVTVSRGILVDEYARTNVEDVYAAGDVAEGFNPLTGKHMANATWTNAAKQGWTAGFNMAGMSVPYPNLRVNISTLFDTHFASVGLLREEKKRNEVYIERVGENYRKLIFEGDLLVGALLIGEVEEAALLARFIERRETYLKLKYELRTQKAFIPYSRLFTPMKM